MLSRSAIWRSNLRLTNLCHVAWFQRSLSLAVSTPAHVLQLHLRIGGNGYKRTCIWDSWLSQQDPVLTNDDVIFPAESPLLPNIDIVEVLRTYVDNDCLRFNYPDYIGPVKVKFLNEQKGRGLFVTRDVKRGELLLMCKALEFVYHSEVSRENKIKESTAKNLEAIGKKTMSELQNRTVKRIENDSHFRSLFESLIHPAHRDRFKKLRPSTTSKSPWDLLIEKFRKNPFSRAKHSQQDSDALKQKSMIDYTIRTSAYGQSPSKKYKRTGIGYWHMPSFVNHSCVPNTVQSVIGNLAFFRAVKDLPVGTEITIHYFTIDALWDRRRKMGYYKFQCSCELCQYESRRDFSLDMLRQQCMDRFMKDFGGPLFEATQRKQFPTELVDSAVSRVEEFLTLHAYKYRPDAYAEELLANLATVFLASGQKRRAVDAYLRAYEQSYVAAGDSGSVFFDSPPNTETIFLLHCISRTYGEMENKGNAAHWHCKALDVLKTCYGTDNEKAYLMVLGLYLGIL